MAIEIEHKYLFESSDIPRILSDSYKIDKIYQGYFHPEFGGRVRVVNGEKGFLTIKAGHGVSKYEFEYEIPIKDAIQLRHICKYKLHKTRYTLMFEGNKWECDVFHNDSYGVNLHGLCVAEIELPHEGYKYEKPAWALDNVTDDKQYSNLSLAVNGMPTMLSFKERLENAIYTKDYMLENKLRDIINLNSEE